jgi:hypothetical protein
MEDMLMNSYIKELRELPKKYPHSSYGRCLMRMAHDMEIWGTTQVELIAGAQALAEGVYQHTPNVRNNWDELLDDYYIYPWAEAPDLLSADPEQSRYFMTRYRDGNGFRGNASYGTELRKINKIYEEKILPKPLDPVSVNPVAAMTRGGIVM